MMYSMFLLSPADLFELVASVSGLCLLHPVYLGAYSGEKTLQRNIRICKIFNKFCSVISFIQSFFAGDLR